MLFVVIIYKILIHHNISLISGYMPLPCYFIGVFLECILMFDVYVNIKCGYIDQSSRKIILDVHKALKHYCSTKLFIHVASAMPLHSLMFLRYGLNDITCVKCKSNLFHCTITLLSAFSLLRMYEMSHIWTRERGSFSVTCFLRFLRIGILGMMTMMEFITFWDAVTMITFLRTGEIDIKSYFSLILYFKLNNHVPSPISLFTHEFARIFKAMLLFNFGFVIRTFYLDKLYSLLSYAISNAFFMWGVIEVFSCVCRGKYPEDQIFRNKGAIINLAKCRQLPDKICLKLQQYFDFNMTMQNIVENQNGLYRSLPAILKKEIKFNSYSRMVMRIPYFSEWPMKMIENLILLLKEETYLKHDVIADVSI